ncbi:ATP-binding protein [Streptomyces sp. ISL-14]|nr:ATP-binding protein [Streptomyces sp. ISL-14]
MTDAIRYGGAPRLWLSKNKTLICQVFDGSSTSPHLRRARPVDEGGRGLFMVAELTQRRGTRWSSAGMAIWAQQLPAH